jgi:myosin-light-chain kinase
MGLSRSKYWKSTFPEDIREKYKIGAILGVGSLGQVRECIHETTKQSFAVKIVEQIPAKASWGMGSFVRLEADLLASLNHPNIVHFIDLYEDSQFLYVIMERCSGGEVFEKLVAQKHFSETEVINFCRQMFSAIEYIHSLDIIHRDIKAENFLFAADGRVKLIDFGLAVRVRNRKQLLADVVGSPQYIAPEMLIHKYSFHVDMWSAGVLLFLMIFGRYPFEDETDDMIFRKIQSGTIVWNNDGIPAPSKSVIDFIKGLLQNDPSARTTPLQALNSPFLRHKSSSELSDNVLIPESIADKLIVKVIGPARTRRKELLHSEAERRRSERIQDLEHQFEDGKHRGRRLSPGSSASVPSSPVATSAKRQPTLGFVGYQKSASTTESLSSPRYPDAKRSRSLPGSRVTFDSKPPDVFVYNEGSGSLAKVGSTEARRKPTARLG